MRLTYIGLRNFGSFADAQVALAHVRAAVVTGANGAGKSTAFIDAVTWGLFGECRVPMDEMLRLGATQMGVTIGFTLSGSEYRVVRMRSLETKAGRSTLTLLTRCGDQWVDSSGARLAETQDKIRVLLSMDYDLLTSTGFLVQGQADRFTRATPTERKTILSQILRLDRYPRLRTLARTKQQVRLAQDLQLGARMGVLLEQREARVPTEEAIVQAQEAQRTWTQAAKEAEVVIAIAVARRAEVVAAQRHRSEWEVERQALKARQASLDSRMVGLREKQTRAQKILVERAKIEAKVQEEAGLEAQLRELDQQLLAAVEEQRTSGQALTDATAEVQKGQVLAGEVDRWAMKLSQDRVTREGLLREAEAEGRRREAEVEMLATVPCDAGLQAQCRFTKSAHEAQAKLPALRATVARGIGEPPVALVLQQEEAQAAWDVWKKREWDATVATIVAEREEAYKGYQAALGQREQVAERVRLVRAFTVLVPELSRAAEDVAGLLLDLDQLGTEAQEVAGALGVVERRLGSSVDGASEVAAIMEAITEEIGKMEGVLREQRAAAEGWAKDEGRLRGRLELCDRADEEWSGLARERAALAPELNRLLQLIEAYARIPVLILESAMPALEQETNRILAKVSRAGMTIRIDTQKALKSRDGLAESLEVVVRDVHGERRYEAYSGGEQFRLNLAMRIGLSKLLAHRAGATLDTLVLDEGLGSLDPDALGQVRECLSALQEEFPLILIVTHVDAMKDTFPDQIHAEAGQNGSTLTVVQ